MFCRHKWHIDNVWYIKPPQPDPKAWHYVKLAEQMMYGSIFGLYEMREMWPA